MEILDLGIPSLKGQTKHDCNHKYCIDKEQFPKIVSCISISCTLFYGIDYEKNVTLLDKCKITSDTLLV